MKKIFSIISKIAVAALPVMLLSLLCGSCSNEDEDTGVTPVVRVAFTLPTAVPMEDMGNIGLLAFDGNGYLAGRWEPFADGATISLGEGKYILIACSGISGGYSVHPEAPIIGRTHIGGMSLRCDGNPSGKLYAGAESVHIKSGSREQVFDIMLSESTAGPGFEISFMDWGTIRNTDVEM